MSVEPKTNAGNIARRNSMRLNGQSYSTRAASASGNLRNRAPSLFFEFLEEVSSEDRNVFGPISKRCRADLNHVQAVVEVVSKVALKKSRLHRKTVVLYLGSPTCCGRDYKQSEYGKSHPPVHGSPSLDCVLGRDQASCAG